MVNTFGNETSLYRNNNLNALNFGLTYNHETCYLYMDTVEVDTISFSISERESITCCGNDTYSTETFVNGVEVENSLIIEIIK